MNDTAATSTTLMPGLVALCQEIRNANWMGGERDGRHFWAIGLDFGFQMQSITCAICGNYQLVSTTDLQQSISPAVLCEDEEHIQYTSDVIEREEDDEDDDEDSDEHEHLVGTQ